MIKYDYMRNTTGVERSIDLPRPPPGAWPGACTARGRGRDDDFDLVRGRRPVLLGPLLIRNADCGSILDVLRILAPVHPHLDTEDDVEGEGEGEAGANDGVANLRRGGEEAGKAAADLGDDGEGGELTGALCAVVLPDLR